MYVVLVWPLVLECIMRMGVECAVCQSEAMVGVLFRVRGSWASGPMQPVCRASLPWVPFCCVLGDAMKQLRTSYRAGATWISVCGAVPVGLSLHASIPTVL